MAEPHPSISSRHPKTGTAVAVLGLTLVLLGASPPLAAQGVTGAAIEGRVLDRDSTPTEQAVVHVTNTSTGERWQTTTSARGRYFIEYLSVGGPYRIDVAAIGFAPERRDSTFLALGQRLIVDFRLTPAALELKEITVTSAGVAARTGPAQIISGSTIARLALGHRDYTELALLSPQVTRSVNGGLSFAGQHDRFNSVQIDGTSNLDPFGSSTSGNGTPGFAVGLTAFTREAVKELQVVTAPFDVRYGNFAGGLINAVTKSGSNRVEGSILGNLESADLTGVDADGNRASQFSRREVGLTLGAPIIRDRVALFVDADVNREVTPQPVPVPIPGDTTTGVLRYESLVRFRDLLRNSNGVDPGGFSTGSYSTPSRNLFVKVTAQLGLNSSLAVSHNYGHGDDRREIGERDAGLYGLSSSGTRSPETINATRLAWTTAFGTRFTNQMTLARVDDRRTCLPSSDFAGVTLVDNDTPDPFAGTELNAGTTTGCLGLETGHTLWEITDNFGMAAGNHRLTFGTHAERIHLVDDVLDAPRGVWTFESLDSLAAGTAASYARDFPAASDSRVAFRVNQIGVYAQDQWVPTPHLTVTAGLRLDIPFAPTPPTWSLKAWNGLGVSTSETPSGNPLWSPRIGVNYDPSGRGTTVLRGGVGLFAGPPAYVWYRNVYGTTGIRALHIDCQGDAVPAFTLDPKHQPTACAEPTPLTAPLAVFDPDFRFPRNLKVAFGIDRLLPGGVVGTVDLLYSRLVNAVELRELNLRGPAGVSAGEGGRVLYGTIDETTGHAIPDRVTDDLTSVTQMRNGSGDRSYSVTAELDKHLSSGTEVSAAYTYTDAKDRMGMVTDRNGPNTASTPLDGTLQHRALRASIWERPHKLTFVGATDLPFGFRLGFTYIGMSGAAYTYVAQGDPNADGSRPGEAVGNDAVYVPRDAGDITLANPGDFGALDSLIREEPCLRSQRGRLLQRDSCRDPWVNETTAQLSKRFHLAARRTLELTADLFNLLNFVRSDWGVVRHTVSDVGNAVQLLHLVGYDTPNSRGIYRLVPVSRREIDPEPSRWRMQLAATVFF
jgi:hypothetical protein